MCLSSDLWLRQQLPLTTPIAVEGICDCANSARKPWKWRDFGMANYRRRLKFDVCGRFGPSEKEFADGSSHDTNRLSPRG